MSSDLKALFGHNCWQMSRKSNVFEVRPIIYADWTYLTCVCEWTHLGTYSTCIYYCTHPEHMWLVYVIGHQSDMFEVCPIWTQVEYIRGASNNICKSHMFEVCANHAGKLYLTSICYLMQVEHPGLASVIQIFKSNQRASDFILTLFEVHENYLFSWSLNCLPSDTPQTCSRCLHHTSNKHHHINIVHITWISDAPRSCSTCVSPTSMTFDPHLTYIVVISPASDTPQTCSRGILHTSHFTYVQHAYHSYHLQPPVLLLAPIYI